MSKRTFIVTLCMVMSGCATAEMPREAGRIESNDGFALIPRIVGLPPLIDGALEREAWGEAAIWEEAFVIDDGSAVAGTFPATIRVLGNEYGLYLGVEIHGLSKIPFSSDQKSGFLSDLLEILLASAQGPLVPPEDMISVANKWEYGSSTMDGYWTGDAWALQADHGDGAYRDGRPTSGRWAPTSSANATLTWEVFIARESSLKEEDAFQMPGPGAFRMALFFIRPPNSEDSSQSEDAHSDTFPGLGQTRTEKDPETWLKLRFDY